jgi:nitrate/TMAO reductase-like tetraheme cytochrome c subunit
MNKLFLFFLMLAIVVGGAGFWYYQQNFYSKETLKLEILSVESADLAQEVEYIVKYKNNGNVRVEDPELIFEYPENSIVQNGSQREILSAEDLGEAIYPGEERTFKFKARLLGKEGDAKIAKAWLSYVPKNLQAKYESTTSFTTIIEKVPLTFEFDFPSKIEAGKESKFRLNYFSNIDYPVSGLRIKIIYPPGFEFISSKPKAMRN